MKNQKIKTVLQIYPMLLFVGLAASCSKNGNETKNKNDSASPASQVKKVAEVWTCPMHPQIKKDGPGKCPICGMDLVKAGSENDADATSTPSNDLPHGHASFQLSEMREQMIGVKYGVVEKKELFKTIEAAGRVAFDPELYNAQNEYIEALRQLGRVQDSPIEDVKHSAERMVQSARLRLKILGLGDDQISRLGTGGANSGASLLIPTPGQSTWVYAEVFEMDLASVVPGLEAKLSGGSLQGEVISAKVVSVDRVLNTETRTAKVRILVSNSKIALRPEAYVDVSILVPLGEQIVVPFDSVLDSGMESWVFVVKEKGKFEPRKIKIRHYAHDEVAVLSGVEAGEKIVTSANFLIDSESRLKGVLSESTNKEATPRTPPSCPEGQVWHEQMNHCMPKAGS